MTPPPPLVVANAWQQLRQFTAARIALGRSGVSVPTQPQLAFQLAHARARDAVHLGLDVPQLLQDLDGAGLAIAKDVLVLASAAPDRLTYLQRPDLGRRLNDASRDALQAYKQPDPQGGYDIAFIIADGLSARAVTQNAVPLMAAAMRQIATENWAMAPLAIVSQARVAIADEIGELLRARLVVLLIGERPGLSSPDSMGVYMTWMPRVGLTDANRNCISNIRPAGLSPEAAAFKLHHLALAMHQRRLSGVLLKDETDGAAAVLDTQRANFLLAHGD